MDSGVSEFDKGYTAGGIAERLDRHDYRLNTINGSIARTADALEGLRSDVKGIQNQMVADASTRIALAAALKEAEEKRLGASEQRMMPYTRVFAFVIVACAIVGVIVQILASGT